MNINIANNACLVDNKDRPLRFSIFGAKNAIFFGDCPMRPEVAEEGIIDAAQAFSPGNNAGDMIYANAQDLGVQSRKRGVFCLIRRDLARSDGCPGERVKDHDYILPAQIAQGQGFSQVCR